MDLLPRGARISEKLSLVTDQPPAQEQPGEVLLPAGPGEGRRPRSFSVRARILAAVVGLAVLALVVAGYTAFIIQQSQVEARVDAELEADAEQFRVLHEVGVDPGTGEGFASPADLVRTAMERIIPTRNEGIVGMVDGSVMFTSPVSPVALEEDPDLIAALSEYAVSRRANFTTVETPVTTYRAAVVPVHAAGGTADLEGNDHEAAAFVMAYDLAAEKAVFSAGFITYAGVAVLSVLVVGLVGWLVAGRLLNPVRVLATAAHRISREDISERIPVSGSDDLAQMTRAFNSMLDRLQGAFRAQDQLVHDVSHELRTPLTIVRGHLEVLDVGDRDDVVATRELTLDELARMNRVIDDLTTLAQADHPGFLRTAPVEVGKLTDEVYDKARGLGARRWLIDARAEGEALLDRERLTQAWLQLAANAVKFSPPDSVISMGSSVRDATIRLSMRDQGCGIAREDMGRIFRRFERSDSSAAGSGLGLPIVEAIAAAHDGRVEVQSAEGAGTTFTIVLPHKAAATSEEAGS